jgi:hypothetical protein
MAKVLPKSTVITNSGGMAQQGGVGLLLQHG